MNTHRMLRFIKIIQKSIFQYNICYCLNMIMQHLSTYLVLYTNLSLFININLKFFNCFIENML